MFELKTLTYLQFFAPDRGELERPWFLVASAPCQYQLVGKHHASLKRDLSGRLSHF